MAECGVSEQMAQAVLRVIHTVSFKGSDTAVPDTIEGKIVQDADRLDAIGAVGIARAFAYGGSRGRSMYDPDVPPAEGMNEKAYRNNRGTTINHFYEKLFLLKDLMNTDTAKKMAEERDAYMHGFVDEFKAEWEGKEDF